MEILYVIMTTNSIRNRWKFFYADDTGVAFPSREQLEEAAPLLISTFADCGMEVHIKKPADTKKAKTVALFCAMQDSVYEREWAEEGGAATFGGTDLSDIVVTGMGVAPFVITGRSPPLRRVF